MKFHVLCLLAFALNAAALEPVSFDALDWDVDSPVYWRWVDKTLHNLAAGGYVSSRAVETPQPFTAQIVLTPKKKLSQGTASAEASLVLRGDGRNAWHWTLADNGRERIPELSLRLGGRKVKLPVNFEQGETFRWEYEVPYTLSLTLEKGRAVATVEDKQGRLLCKAIGDGSDAGNFPVRPAVHATTLRCAFDAPQASRVEYRKEDYRFPPQTFTPAHRYASPSNVSREFSGEGTGFFRIARAPSGQYWFIDPAGKAMFFCGVDMLIYGGRHCEALGYSPYGRNMDRVFGGDRERWAGDTMRRLSDWGFNYAGTQEKNFRTKLPFSVNLMIGSSFASFGDDYDLTPYLGHVGSAMPNPFHPRFAEWARRCYLRSAGTEINNPYFVGYFSDNELRWLGAPRNPEGTGLFNNVMAKRRGHSAKEALVRFLAERHENNIDAFNAEWKLRLKTFDEIQDLGKLEHHTPRQILVKQDFLSLVADTYFSTIRDAIRELDPNHLFLGCRFAGYSSNHERVWRSTGKYCDVVSFNQYPSADLLRNKLWITSMDLPSAFEEIHRWSGRPLMITEWAFLGLDSGLPCQYGAGQRLDTQEERAAAAELFVRTTASMPFMVGLNWYKHGDDPKLGVRANFPENSNYGLVNEENEPYSELTDMFRKVHSDIDATRRNKPQELKLPAGGGVLYRELTAPAGKDAKTAPGLQIAKDSIGNGEISLRYDEKGPRIAYFRNGEKLGEITFLLRYQMNNGKNDWVYIDRISDIRTKRLAQSAELSLTGSGKTEDGTFQFTARLLLAARGDRLIAEVTSVRNTGNTPLRMCGIYFSAFPAFEPEIRKISRIELNRAAWHRPDGAYFGAASGFTWIRFRFFRTEDKVLHPDGYHPLVQTLRPDETLKMAEPCYIFVFSGRGDYQPHARELLRQDLAH